MIVEAFVVNTPAGEFKRVTMVEDYFAVGYVGDQILKVSIFDEELPRNGAFEGGLVTDGNIAMQGFCSDSYEELVAEIEKRGLKYP